MVLPERPVVLLIRAFLGEGPDDSEAVTVVSPECPVCLLRRAFLGEGSDKSEAVTVVSPECPSSCCSGCITASMRILFFDVSSALPSRFPGFDSLPPEEIPSSSDAAVAA